MLQIINKPFRWTLIFGVLMLVVSTVLVVLGPTPISEGYSSAIVAFEFVEHKADLDEVLLGGDVDRMTSLDMINRLDWLFIVLYGGVLFSFIRKLGELTSTKWVSYAAWLVPIEVLCDYFENHQLLQLTATYPQADHQLYRLIQWLQISTWAKWLLLAVIMWIAGRGILQLGRYKWIGYVLHAVLLSGVLALVATITSDVEPTVFFVRKLQDVFTTFVLLGFVLVLAYGVFYKTE